MMIIVPDDCIDICNNIFFQERFVMKEIWKKVAIMESEQTVRISNISNMGIQEKDGKPFKDPRPHSLPSMSTRRKWSTLTASG